MNTHTRITAAVAGLCSVAMVVAACGSSGSNASGSSSTPTSSGAASSSAAASSQAVPSSQAAPSSQAPAGSSASAPASAGSNTAASSTAGGSPADTAASSTAGGLPALATVCPNPIKVQINWTPEVEQSAYYQLAASDGSIDSNQKTYTAALVDPFNGKKTGVNVEIIAGGPSVGYSAPEQLLYENPDILLGMDALDVQIQSYAKTPTIGIVSPMTYYANIKFWGPDALHISSLADMGKSGATVLTENKTGPLTLYLESKGWLNPSQVDGSYKGSPARFVTSNGNVISQGYATYEPYYYAHILKQWMKPIAYTLLYTNGYDPYSESTFVTPANLKKYAACLKQLVPMIQKAQLNYLQSPDRINDLVVKLVGAYKIAGGFYNLDIAKYAHDTMLADKIMAQPEKGAFGSYNLDRVDSFVKIMTSTKTVTNLPSGFSSSNLATNQFIDPSVNMTFYHGPYNNVNGVITEK
ncbi:MAG: hypothetical protein ACR2P2_22580 [Nakamurella sp.]